MWLRLIPRRALLIPEKRLPELARVLSIVLQTPVTSEQAREINNKLIDMLLGGA